MTPSEAARKRWADRKAREAEPKHEDDGQAKVIATLRRKAESGDVQAARELREWLARFDPEAGRDRIWPLLTREQRAQVRAWLEENAAQERIA